MPEPRPPLDDLLGPLRFATGPGARLERIGGLAELVRAKVGAWRAALPPGATGHGRAECWLNALAGFEAMDPARREAALRTVLAGIEQELAAGAAPDSATAPAGGAPDRRAAPPASASVSGAALPLDAAVSVLPGVGERRQALLARLGIHTVGDLLLHLPARHEDRRDVAAIGALSPGRPATVRARVEGVEVKTTPRRRMKIVEALVTDASAMGGAMVMRWFNQPHRARQLAVGSEYLFSGKAMVDRGGLSLVMENPEFEPWEAGEDTLHAGRVVAVYPVTEGLNSALLRKWVAAALARARIDDPIDPALRRRLDLPERAAALALAHRPERPELAAAGVRRLAFEEFYYLQLGLALKAAGRARRHTGITFPDRPGALEAALLKALPFALTDAQGRVLADIGRDLARDVPTQRLIQGDVGCGKTVVALLALLRAVDNGFQGAIMAPTEVLAAQHFQKISALLAGLPVNAELLVGGARGKSRALARIAGGEAHLVVGTQALIQDRVTFRNLGLAVVDEQHRFGVRQRARMAAKGAAPHTLIMTATPIPRSLAMTVYGDLDLSVIDALPPGRRPVTTRLFFEDRRDRAYDLVRREVAAGRRAYVVHPLVEESEKTDLRAATAAYEELAAGVLAGIRLGLLHGRMGGEEKARVMADFASGAIQVLVTTTVVEVGVDVAEATVMVIEHAERFGLSQLHQLRGRVGRGAHAGHCLLVASRAVSKEGRQRLDAMVETADGFRIAERDLEIRGPGELFGQRQSGVPELRVANLIRDAALLAAAREAARQTLAADPELTAPEHRALRDTVARLWRHRLKWGAVG